MGKKCLNAKININKTRIWQFFSLFSIANKQHLRVFLQIKIIINFAELRWKYWMKKIENKKRMIFCNQVRLTSIVSNQHVHNVNSSSVRLPAWPGALQRWSHKGVILLVIRNRNYHTYKLLMLWDFDAIKPSNHSDTWLFICFGIFPSSHLKIDVRFALLLEQRTQEC